MAKEVVPFNPAEMDKAAEAARAKFANLGEAHQRIIAKWYTDPVTGYMKAGHKRLGRLIVEYGKSQTKTNGSETK